MDAGPLDPSLLPEGAVLREGDVEVGGCSLAVLASEHGTPLFVYDEASLRARCAEAAAAFDEGVAFASKSFLCQAMARLAVEEGLCVDVATGGELDLVLRAGVDPQRVILHGNNKSEAELERAIGARVRRIVVDSFDEIDRLERLGGGRPIDCLVRVTPGIEAHTHEFVRTGQEDTKFGLSLATGEAARALARLRSLPGVSVRGLHAHVGSQIFDLEPFVATLAALGEFAGDSLEELCVGGGLGVAYVAGERAPTITEWGAAVRAGARAAGLDPATRILAEPGRSIVARAAVTLYRVGTVKRAAGRTYVAVDGGMSDNPRPVLYGSGYEVFDVGAPRAARPREVRVVGKHCESGDVLVERGQLPESTGVGSLVATPVTGAYGYSMASTYNRVPRPAVLFVADGAARVVLRRETFEDLARLEQ